jgi:hypothetical protein
MTTANTTLADQLAPLAGELATIQDQIATLQLVEAALKSKIRDTCPGPDSYAAGNLTVVVSSNRRFNPERAAQVIAPDLLPLVSVITSVIDKTKVSVLCPDQFDACFTEYDLKVALK